MTNDLTAPPTVPRGTVATQCSDLRGRLVRADDACACCANAATKSAARLAQLVLALVAEIIRAGNIGGAPSDTPDIALAPAASAGFTTLAPGKVAAPRVGEFTVRGLPRGSPAAAGTVLLVVGEVAWLVARDIAALNALQTLADAIPLLVSAATKTARGSCLECVAGSLLPQSSRRRRGRYSYAKRT